MDLQHVTDFSNYDSSNALAPGAPGFGNAWVPLGAQAKAVLSSATHGFKTLADSSAFQTIVRQAINEPVVGPNVIGRLYFTRNQFNYCGIHLYVNAASAGAATTSYWARYSATPDVFHVGKNAAKDLTNPATDTFAAGSLANVALSGMTDGTAYYIEFSVHLDGSNNRVLTARMYDVATDTQIGATVSASDAAGGALVYTNSTHNVAFTIGDTFDNVQRVDFGTITSTANDAGWLMRERSTATNYVFDGPRARIANPVSSYQLWQTDPFTGASSMIASGASPKFTVDQSLLPLNTTKWLFRRVVDNVAGTFDTTSFLFRAKGPLYRIGLVGDSTSALPYQPFSGGQVSDQVNKRFEKYLSAMTGRDVEVANFAVSATKTTDWLPGTANMNAVDAAPACDGYIVMLGLNDLDGAMSVATHTSQLNTIGARLAARTAPSSGTPSKVWIFSATMCDGAVAGRSNANLPLFAQAEAALPYFASDSTLYNSFLSRGHFLRGDGLHESDFGFDRTFANIAHIAAESSERSFSGSSGQFASLGRPFSGNHGRFIAL